MTYIVEYKKVNSLFWRKIKGVKADFSAPDLSDKPRVFILENETRIEIPTKGVMFRFSSERFLVIKQQMEKESGQRLNTNSKLTE